LGQLAPGQVGASTTIVCSCTLPINGQSAAIDNGIAVSGLKKKEQVLRGWLSIDALLRAALSMREQGLFGLRPPWKL